MPNAAFAAFGSVIADMSTTFGDACSVRLSKMAPLGWPLRPRRPRSSKRRREPSRQNSQRSAIFASVDTQQTRKASHAPCRDGTYHPAQSIKHFSEVILLLSGILGQEDEIGSNEGPFVVAAIPWIGGSSYYRTMDHCLA